MPQKRPLSSYSDECFTGKRLKTLGTLIDEHAWDYEPEELIGESIYAHTGSDLTV